MVEKNRGFLRFFRICGPEIAYFVGVTLAPRHVRYWRTWIGSMASSGQGGSSKKTSSLASSARLSFCVRAGQLGYLFAGQEQAHAARAYCSM